MIGSSKSYEDFVRSFVENEEKEKFKINPRITMYILLTVIGVTLILLSTLTTIFGKIGSQVVCVVGIILASSVLLIFWEIYKLALAHHNPDEDTML